MSLSMSLTQFIKGAWQQYGKNVILEVRSSNVLFINITIPILHFTIVLTLLLLYRVKSGRLETSISMDNVPIAALGGFSNDNFSLGDDTQV